MDSSASGTSGNSGTNKEEIIFCKFCWKKCFSSGDFFLHWKEAHLKATWKKFASTSTDLSSAVFTINPLCLNLAGKSYEVFASSGLNFWENYEEDASNDERGEWISLEELCAEINIETARSLPSPATNEDEYTYDRTCTENNTFPCVKCRRHFESTDSLLAHRVECLIKIGKMKLVKSTSEVSGYEVVNDVTGHETQSPSSDLNTEIPLSSALAPNENLVEEETKQMPSSSKEGKGRKFKCDYPGCSKRYKEERKLIKHGFKHSGVLSFVCSDCPMEFRKNRYLEKHRKECGGKEARIEKEAPPLSISISPTAPTEPEIPHYDPVPTNHAVEIETPTANISTVEPIAVDSIIPGEPMSQNLEITLPSPKNTHTLGELENQNLPSIITDPTKVLPLNIDSGEPKTKTYSKSSRCLTRELAALKRDNDNFERISPTNRFRTSNPSSSTFEQMNSPNSVNANLENGNDQNHYPMDNQSNHPAEITISSTPMPRRKVGQPTRKRYQCLRCGKRFFTLTEKTQHRSVPCKRSQGWATIGMREYICGLCGKELSNSTNLENHTRTHTKEKPFKCSNCLRGFVSENSRYMHELSHRKGGVLNNKKEEEDSGERSSTLPMELNNTSSTLKDAKEIKFVDLETETEIQVEDNTSSETEGLDGSESSSDLLQLNSTPFHYAKIGLSQHYSRNSSCHPTKLVQQTKNETNLPTTSKLLPPTNYHVDSTMVAMPPPTTHYIIVTTGQNQDTSVVCPICTGHMKFVGPKDELKDHIKADH